MDNSGASFFLSGPVPQVVGGLRAPVMCPQLIKGLVNRSSSRNSIGTFSFRPIPVLKIMGEGREDHIFHMQLSEFFLDLAPGYSFTE